jgi:hypothetical protein
MFFKNENPLQIKKIARGLKSITLARTANQPNLEYI